MKQTFEVLNVKCGSCANTLIKTLKKSLEMTGSNLETTKTNY